MAELGPRDLFDAAWSAMQKTHSPYSKFPVGASMRTADGRVYSGCNIEVASYPEGWCAETTMLGHYVMGGGGGIDGNLRRRGKDGKLHPLRRLPSAAGGICRAEDKALSV